MVGVLEVVGWHAAGKHRRLHVPDGLGVSSGAEQHHRFPFDAAVCDFLGQRVTHAHDLVEVVAHVDQAAGANMLVVDDAADQHVTDVVRLRFFVTRWSPDRMDAFLAGISAVADELGIPQPFPPASLIGVDYLFEPDVLVEVEAFAVLD